MHWVEISVLYHSGEDMIVQIAFKNRWGFKFIFHVNVYFSEWVYAQWDNDSHSGN